MIPFKLRDTVLSEEQTINIIFLTRSLLSPDIKINPDSSKINVNERTHKPPERKSGWLHEQSRGTNVLTKTQKS